MIYIPWTLIPGLIAFGAAFVLEFVMIYYADHEKIANGRNPTYTHLHVLGERTVCRIADADRSSNSIMDTSVCVAVFLISIIITLFVYGRH